MVRRTFLLTIVAAAILTGGLIFGQGWRVEPVGGEKIPNARPSPYSTAECTRLCAAATLEFPGVTATMSGDAFEQLVQARLDAKSANDFAIAHGDSRLLLLDGKLFFPNDELCDQTALTGDCASACKRYKLKVSKLL